MKFIPLLLVFGLALSLCNLSKKLHGGGSSNTNSGTSSSSNSSGAPAEKGEATSIQLAALSGGSEIKWEQQGMSFSVPPKWTEVSKESKMFVWHSPGGFDAATLNVTISPMDENFPAEVSLNATYDGEKTRAKNGEVDELKWVEIDGVKGVQFREANPEKPDDFRRLHWMTYRKFAGQLQLVNVMLASSGKGFPNHQDEMYGILYSTKITH